MKLMNQRKCKFIRLCLICSAIYVVNRYFELPPDFLEGVLLGLGIGFLILAFLPDGAWDRLQAWKRGENT